MCSRRTLTSSRSSWRSSRTSSSRGRSWIRPPSSNDWRGSHEDGRDRELRRGRPPGARPPPGGWRGGGGEGGGVMTAADYEFAGRAGTAAMQTCMGLTISEMYKFGMAVGADTSQGAPGDALEYSASAGAAAFLIGTEKPIATINHTLSYTTDTPDF